MKFDQLPKGDKHGRDLQVENGIIKSVSLTTMDHGCLTGWLFIEFEGGGCGFGGFKLGNANPDALDRSGGDFASYWIARCIKTVTGDGYGTWEGLAGKPIRVVHEGLGGQIVAIGHFLKDEWFCPRIEFKE